VCLEELSSSEKKALLMNILTKVPDFEQEWEVPDITGWDKFQVYNYLKDRNLPVEVTDLIIKKVSHMLNTKNNLCVRILLNCFKF